LVSKGWIHSIRSKHNQSTADNRALGGNRKGGKNPVFPHNPLNPKLDKGDVRSTPVRKSLTWDFAILSGRIDLGAGGITRFSYDNLASTDYVGHRYGPNSIEVEDTYLRLDKDLASFFSYLDNRLGKGNYTVFLTADHGAAHAINFMKEHGLPADFLSTTEIVNSLKEFLKQEFGDETLVRNDNNYHLSVNKQKIKDLKLDYEKVKRETVKFLQTLPGIEFAADIENLGNSSIPEPIKMMIANGYNPKRAGELIIIQNSGWFGSNGKGTTHGAWNPYDTHIPLIFMGWGIPHGKSSATYHMTDIAPTISALLHIQMGSGNVGRVITEVVK